jgi:peptide methionine sulfoxide reductase msrA/msrB
VAHRTYSKPSQDELRRALTPLQYKVTQEDATEPAFRNEFWNNHARGLYVDVATGEPLFSSLDKFDSGTGWPSFSRPVEESHITRKADPSYGRLRTEVRSAAGGSHLGHVFDDGPAPTGLRYCINSAALRFVPEDRIEADGYGEYAAGFANGGSSVPLAPSTANACAVPAPASTPGCESTLETAIFSGGCFWGMEELLRAVPGVLETEVGYAGGATVNPRYADVKTGSTGHAESIRVVFDPKAISYADLLEKWFFRMHDPTTRNRQGNDVGSQYRSAIFYVSEEQRVVAEDVKARLTKSGKWPRPVVTEVVPAGPFTAAEDYHQDYLQKNPGGYTCHFMRD